MIFQNFFQNINYIKMPYTLRSSKNKIINEDVEFKRGKPIFKIQNFNAEYKTSNVQTNKLLIMLFTLNVFMSCIIVYQFSYNHFDFFEKYIKNDGIYKYICSINLSNYIPDINNTFTNIYASAINNISNFQNSFCKHVIYGFQRRFL